MGPENTDIELPRNVVAKSLMLGKGLDRHTAAVLDARMAGIGTQAVSSLYYHTLRVRALEAELDLYGKNTGRAQRLMHLLDEDRVALSKLRRDARDSKDDNYMSTYEHRRRIEYIEKSKNQKEIKAILLELGLTEMLLFGDWKVNREGGEKPRTKSFMPSGDLGDEVLKEARVLRRVLKGNLKQIVVAKAKRIGELIDLPLPSAVTVALRELDKTEATESRISTSKTSDIAVESSVSGDISSSMGIVPFNEVESLILQFYRESGLLANTAPIIDGKLTALDLGCGNGVTAERLRRDATDPFGNGRRLVNYWAEIGFADKIYWTLPDLIYNLIREEHKSDPAVLEFAEVVSTLLIRRINQLKRYPPKELNKYDKTILSLPTNPNVIRVILPNLEHYIQDFAGLKKFKTDGEFESDSEHVISKNCRELIEDYFEGPGIFRAVHDEAKPGESELLDAVFGPNKFAEKRATRAFLKTYFNDEAIEHGDKIEKTIKARQAEILQVGEEYDRTTGEMKSLQERRKALCERLAATDLSEDEQAKLRAEKDALDLEVSQLIERRKEIKLREKAFILSKKALERDRTDLAGEITIYPHNVVLGDFADFKTVMPDAPAFDWVRSWRASSHADDEQYAELIEACAYRLKPGGIITEDGKRESYTRFERVEQLQALQKKLGGEYRVSLIAKANGPSGVLIERAVVRKDGETIFFSEKKGKKLLRQDVQLVPVDIFAARWPEMLVRNEMISRFRHYFIDSLLQDCGPEETRKRTYQGRMQFRDLHAPLDKCLEDNFFNSEEWNEKIKFKVPGDSEYDEYIERVWGTVVSEIFKVRRRVEAVTKGAVLLRSESAVIRTFPLRYPVDEKVGRSISHSRSCRVKDLPRNSNIPDLSDAKLENERQSLVTALSEIRKLTGKPPLRLHLYNCFTDVAMLDTVLTLLGVGEDPEKRELFRTTNVKIEGSYDPAAGEKVYSYPEQEDGVIDIFGGSTNDAYDDGGKNYIEEFVMPWLSAVDGGARVRGLGICFGSQCILEGLGKLKGFDVKTERGALQFGPFPVVFGERHVAVKHLANQACTAVFTRSGYSIPDDSILSRINLRPLAFEGKMSENGIWLPNQELPPVAFSLLDGRVMTTQMHLEANITDPRHLQPLSRYAGRHAKGLSETFGHTLFLSKNPLASPNYLRDHHFGLDAEDVFGKKTKWVTRDIGMAFLIPSLLHLANDLLNELQSKRLGL